jgi:hypothetical protein
MSDVTSGISLYNWDYKISTDSIYNNFIAINTNTVDSSLRIDGLFVNDIVGCKTYIHFNTIVIGGNNMNGNPHNSYALNYSYMAGEAIIKNNIFINKLSNGEGTKDNYCVWFNKSGTPNLTSDYNLLLCDEIDGAIGLSYNEIGYYNTFCATLKDWQDSTGLDLHSVSKEVEFVGTETGDLHLAGSSLIDTDLHGIYIAGINDIDNEERRADGTFMGADQPPFFGPCIPGTATDPENIIENGDFGDCILAPWWMYYDTANGATANAAIIDGQFNLSGITLAGAPEYWQVQLNEAFTDAQISRLTAGDDFILSFDAWSKSGSRPCHLFFGQSEFPYADMLNQDITIDAVHRSYSYEFLLSTIYDHKMRLSLDFGADAKMVTLDNIRLVKKAVNSARLSGLKTVGNGGDYATLTDAVLDVNTNGLNGNAIFEIKDGYDKTEAITILSYPGNDQYTLTIRPEAGAAEVILRSETHSIPILLYSTNNIIIDGRSGGTAGSCALKVKHSNKENSAAILVDNSKNTIVRYCDIRYDCSAGVSFYECDSTIVENCDIATYTNGPISNGGTIAIGIAQSTNSIVRNNIIHDLHVDSVYYIIGIDLSNEIYRISTDSIYNNFIAINTGAVDSSALIEAISISGNEGEGSRTHIYFNTVVVGGKGINGNGYSSIALHYEIYSGEGFIKNNLFINKRSNREGIKPHYCVGYHIWGTSTLTSDYNLFLCNETDGMTGGNKVNSYATLTEWQDSTGLDLHSVSKEVEFAGVETGNMHLAGSSLTDTALYGLYMAGINDIDNEERWAAGTFMGADQPPYFEPCIPGTANDPENIIENGDFEDCILAPWFVYIETINGAAANAAIIDGQFTLSGIILAGAPEYWQVQLMQVFSDAQIGKLIAGEDYILSFDAWSASGSRPCHLSFGQSEFPYDDMLDQFITIDAVHRSYSYEFLLSTIYEHKMRLALDFGTDATPVTLDNVRLVKKAVNSLTGVNREPAVKIMPNPATDFIQIEAQDGSTVSLFNCLGMMVRSEIVSDGQVLFKISDLSKGIYLVKVSSRRNVITEKVIIQ